jgi:hypothetical protein
LVGSPERVLDQHPVARKTVEKGLGQHARARGMQGSRDEGRNRWEGTDVWCDKWPETRAAAGAGGLSVACRPVGFCRFGKHCLLGVEFSAPPMVRGVRIRAVG